MEINIAAYIHEDKEYHMNVQKYSAYHINFKLLFVIPFFVKSVFLWNHVANYCWLCML